MPDPHLVKLDRPGAPFLTVTSRAAQAIRAATANQPGPVAGLRLAIEGGRGCCHTERHALRLESVESPDDVVVESAGVRILLGRDDARVLRGAVLDYEETAEDAGFRVVSDSREHQCGCDHAD